MGWRRRDPRQARFLTRASLAWVWRHRAFTPHYLLRYWRFALLRLRRADVVTEGFVFLGRDVELTAPRGRGRIVLGRWSHLGDGTAIRAHEGTVRIGDKAVLGADVRINGYLDIEVGAATLIADWVYVADFDHVTTDPARPIKDQGIVKSPVRIGPDCWLGTKATVTRGVRIGRGSVLAANAVATRDIDAYSIAGGVPARVLRSRLPAPERRTDPPERMAGSAERRAAEPERIAGSPELLVEFPERRPESPERRVEAAEWRVAEPERRIEAAERPGRTARFAPGPTPGRP